MDSKKVDLLQRMYVELQHLYEECVNTYKTLETIKGEIHCTRRKIGSALEQLDELSRFSASQPKQKGPRMGPRR